MARFSSRLPSELSQNRLTRAVVEARRAGRTFVDLTQSNPTRAGFEYPAGLLAPLSDPRGLEYRPEPLGLACARRAVALDYARRGVAIDPDRIALAASTSEAYSLLFKLLCDPGDEVLAPRPSYPLLDHLTRLDSVAIRPYDLEYHGSWTVDLAGLERAFTPRTRAVLIVSPNNPTGSFVIDGEFDKISAACATHGVAILADEVFADYSLADGAGSRPEGDGHGDVSGARDGRRPARVLDCVDALTFGLGGLSKSIGLPQAKLGWIAVAGPSAEVDVALGRLEVICDAYLSVSTPVQAAAAELLDRGRVVRAQIQARGVANYRALVAATARTASCRTLGAEGGWYGVVQVPTLGPEEDLVVDLLERHGVLVHPGYFFDFPRESFLVVSLLPPESVFVDGVSRLLGAFDPPEGELSAAHART